MYIIIYVYIYTYTHKHVGARTHTRTHIHKLHNFTIQQVSNCVALKVIKSLLCFSNAFIDCINYSEGTVLGIKSVFVSL